MSFADKESRQERYDVIVVGAGIGGLSAAALLAKAGKAVLLVERHDRPGGCAHGFTRRKYQFDAGVHLVSGCGPTGYRKGRIIHAIGQALGLPLETLFVPVNPYIRACYPGLDVLLHSGEDALVAGLGEAFPHEREAIRNISRLCLAVAEELMVAEEWMDEPASQTRAMSQTLPHLFRYRRATVDRVLERFTGNPRLRAALGSLWPYLGLPPSRLAFLSWATMMAGYTYEGGYYCRGRFQAYADTLARSIAAQGGEVLLNASVRRILVDSGTVSGVMLENGQIIRTGAVIANADARQTAELLIGREHLPQRHLENLAGLRPSLSAFVVYLATDLDLSRYAHAHETFFYADLDHDRRYAATAAGRADWFSATVPTLVDPAMAPPGQHLMLLTALCPYVPGASWRSAKPEFQQRILEQAERHFPGLNSRLAFVESGSPRTVERYTLNGQGAAYGWEPSLDQIGSRRPGVRGVLPGLYHAGHWTRPGGGIAAVSYSGVLAAQAVLGIRRQEDFWKALEAAAR